VRQSSGQPVSPESVNDEEMKLLVLGGLINTDPDRTVPILEKLLKSGNSARVKERALFVLAQGHSEKGRELILQVARGNYNPDLQVQAIRYLGVFNGTENTQLLGDIYKGSSDVQVKREVLHAYSISGNADRILDVARTEKDPNLRREAIQQLGPMGRSKSGDALAALYAKETDPSVKRDIQNALFVQANAPALIDIARKETDPTLKREALERLTHMHSKEATDFLLEMLNK
jgi:HEAT repeat protein